MINSRELSNMTVLVTRPQHLADPLCQMIAAKGGNALRLPALTIEPLLSAADSRTITSLVHYDMAIFVSVNAVLHSLPLIRQWPDHLLAFAIGAATANMLQSCGVSQIGTPERQFNSEALLQLPALQQIAGRQIMLFCGQDGRKHVVTELRKRAAYVQEVICYRRCLPTVDKQYCQALRQDQQIDIIVCTSVTGMTNLFTLFGTAGRDWLQRSKWLVISERMLSVAQTLGITKVPLLAEQASDDAIMVALQHSA